MICISPIAPLGDRACTSPALSTRITARIQDAGTPNRCDASAMGAANGSAAEPPCREIICGAGSGLAARPITSIEEITAAMTSAAALMRRDEIDVVLAVQAMTGKEEGIGAGDGGATEEYRQIGGIVSPPRRSREAR